MRVLGFRVRPEPWSSLRCKVQRCKAEGRFVESRDQGPG